MQKWDKMTPAEREAYINQDYVARKEIIVDPDIFTDDHSLGNLSSPYPSLFEIEELCLDKLSRREQQVMILLCQGFTQERIGKCLGVTRSTARNYIYNLRDKIKKFYINNST